MNGVRSIFRRKGYLLTALSAAVLLAASSGTAWAQGKATLTGDGIEVDVRDVFTMNEGTSLEVEISIEAEIPAGEDDDLEVTLLVSAMGLAYAARDLRAGPAEGRDYDLDDLDAGRLTFTFEDTEGLAALEGDDPPYTATATNTFIIDAESDSDAEDEGVRLTIAADSDSNIADDVDVDAVVKNFIIYDDETQDYILELARRAIPREGGTFGVSLEADPEFESDKAELTLAFFDQEGERDLRNYTVDGMGVENSKVTLGLSVADTDSEAEVVAATAVEGQPVEFVDLTITALADKNRVTDTITLAAYIGSAAGGQRLTSLDIDIRDIHALAAEDDIKAVARDKAKNGDEVMQIVEGGDPVYLTITVDRGSGATATTKEALTIDVRAADLSQANDYEVTPTRVSLAEVSRPNGKQSTEVEIKLSALPNDDVSDEELVLNLEVSGTPSLGTETSTGTFTIAIVDETDPKIWALPEADAYPAIEDAIKAAAGDDEELNPGESFSVMTSDLFGLEEGYTATYRASVVGDAVSISASGDSLKVNAETAGSAKVTVTGKANMSSSSFLPEQTVSDEASITFEVMVADKVLVVMLEMPANVMDGNIVEGESYDIMVSANRMVMEDTEVMIMRDRSGSDADDSDFSVSMATIMAGYDSATAELMVTEDMMPDGGTDDNMGESLVLYGMVDGEETNSLTFTIWDQAVPTLPLIGQLLLALFLMAGGARLYRRRQG